MKLVKTVKSISSKTFEITLVELFSGGYHVITGKDNAVIMSDKILDYGTASYLFDLKLRDLEGM